MVERGPERQARWLVQGPCGLKSAPRFMESPLVLADVLTGHEPRRDELRESHSPEVGASCNSALRTERFMGSLEARHRLLVTPRFVGPSTLTRSVRVFPPSVIRARK